MTKASPAMKKRIPEFLTTLQDEHHYFQSLLDIAREQQVLLEDDEDIDFNILQDLLQYLAEYPEDYHHPKEDLLLDRLREVDSASKIIVNRVLATHEDMHKEVNRLYYSVVRANNGEKINRLSMATDLKRFINGYEKHMHDENDVVFVRAFEALSAKDWKHLDATLDHIDDPLFGTRVRRRYRRLAGMLEGRLGLAKRELAMAEFLTLGAVIDGMMTISNTTIDLGHILFDRTGQMWQENLTAARDSVSSGELGPVISLPSQFGTNTFNNLRGGFREAKDLLCKAADEIRTPYNMRMDTLKDLLREDWRR